MPFSSDIVKANEISFMKRRDCHHMILKRQLCCELDFILEPSLDVIMGQFTNCELHGRAMELNPDHPYLRM